MSKAQTTWPDLAGRPHGPQPSPAAGERPPLRAKWCQTPEGLASLRPEWNELLSRSEAETVFLTWEWVSIWWRHFGSGQELWVIELRDEAGTLLGIAPLKRRRAPGRLGPVRYVEFLGSGGVALPDHLNFIFERGHEASGLRAVMDALEERASEWDLLFLTDLARASASGRALSSWAAARRRPVHRFRSAICPYLPLPASWEELEAGLSPALRKNVRYYGRRAEKMGARVAARETPEEVAAGFGELARLHQLRMEDTERGGNFANPAYVAFHRDLMEEFSRHGWLDLKFLELEGKAIAVKYSFRYRGVLSIYQMGLDPAHYALSAGTVLMGALVRQLIDGGFREVDMLRGPGYWKYRWTRLERVNHTHVLPRPGWRGARAYLSDLLGLNAPLLLKRLLPSRAFDGLRGGVRRLRERARSSPALVSLALALVLGAAPAARATDVHYLEGLAADVYEVRRDTTLLGDYVLIGTETVLEGEVLAFEAPTGGRFRADSTGTAESVAPAAVTDLLAAPGPLHGSIRLRWTATGDDTTAGTAASYEMRSAPDSITAATWLAATPLSGLPTPAPAGSPESLLVEDLAQGATSWFSLRAKDEWGNRSDVSNASPAIAADLVAPDAVDDLAADSGGAPGEIDLTWTATGDDGVIGQAAGYLGRVAADSITEATWSAATPAAAPAVPAGPGTPESWTLTGLDPGVAYWVAIRVVDDAGNPSAISNSARATTPLAPDVLPPDPVDDLTATRGGAPGEIDLTWTATGDDGALGQAESYLVRVAADSITSATWDAATPAAAPSAPAGPGTPESWTLSGLDPGVAYWVAIRVVDDAGNPSAVSNSARATADEAALAPHIGFFQNPILTRYLTLLAIMNRAVMDTSVAAELNGAPLAMELVNADLRIYGSDFRLTGEGAIALEVCARDLEGDRACAERAALVALVTRERGGIGRSPDGRLALRFDPGAAAESLFVVVSPEADPEAAASYFVSPAVGALAAPVEIRLALDPALDGPAEEAPRIGLYLRRGDEWRALRTFFDPARRELVALTEELGPIRALAGSGIPPAEILPAEARLLGNRPNPFNPLTVVAFELPVREEVRLSVMDVSGRRVRVLAQGFRGPGREEAAWNGLDDEGRPVASGVYFLRLEAPGTVSSHKMILLK